MGKALWALHTQCMWVRMYSLQVSLLFFTWRYQWINNHFLINTASIHQVSLFGRGTLHVSVEDEEQKAWAQTGPQYQFNVLNPISCLMYTSETMWHFFEFHPQRCLLQRCVRLQNPKFHHLREKVFNNIPSILSGISIWLFCLKKAIDQH